jgi:hypothetical protein
MFAGMARGGNMTFGYTLFFVVFLGFYLILMLALLFSDRLERGRRGRRRPSRPETFYDDEDTLKLNI